MWGQNQSMFNVTSFQWVIGEAGANAAYVSPGTSALLMDSQQQIFWVKTVDYSGRPIQMRRFRFEDDLQAQPQIQQQGQQPAWTDLDRRVAALEAVLTQAKEGQENNG